MIPQQLKQMFGLSSEKDQSMANNIWKMLDQMSENSPQKYRQFIEKNIKQGVQQVKQKKDQKQKPYKIKPQKGFLLQFDVILNQKYLNHSQLQQDKPNFISEKLQEKLHINNEDWQQIRNKFSSKVHILLNVCFSDRVKIPQDKSRKQLHNLTVDRIKEIQIFYYSLKGPQQFQNKKNKQKEWHFCMILSKNLFQSLMRNNQYGKKMLMSLCLSYFQQRLQNDYNPLLKLYKPQAYRRLVFYSIEKESIQINSQRNYFLSGTSQVQEVLLQKQIDIKRQKEVKQQEQKGNEKLRQQEKKKEIKFKVEEKNQELISHGKNEKNKEFEKQKQQKNIQNSKINCSKKPNQKKFLIQVLNETQTNDSSIRQFPYQLRESQESYHIQILVSGIQSIQQIDLEISDLQIKLKTIKDTDYTIINFQKPINSQTVKAKYKKKLGRLIVDAPFLNYKNN